MNSRYYIIAIIVIALGIVGYYTIYKSKPSVQSDAENITLSPTQVPTQPASTQAPTPPSSTQAPTTSAPKAPSAAIFPDGYTQIVSGVPFSWSNSTISFKNISNNTITIYFIQLENGYPNMPAPAGMTLSGTQRYNIPIKGTLAPGESTSFKMPDRIPMNVPEYGIVNYNFSLLTLSTNLGTSNIRITGGNTANISFDNAPTTNIVVQYHP
jgi:hypothetical protein